MIGEHRTAAVLGLSNQSQRMFVIALISSPDDIIANITCIMGKDNLGGRRPLGVSELEIAELAMRTISAQRGRRSRPRSRG